MPVESQADKLKEGTLKLWKESVKQELSEDTESADFEENESANAESQDNVTANGEADLEVGQGAEPHQSQNSAEKQTVQFEEHPEWEQTLSSDLQPDGIPKDQDGTRKWGVSVDFDELPESIRDKWVQRFNQFYRSQAATDRHLNQLGQDLPQMIEAKAYELMQQQQQEAQYKDSRKREISEALESLDYEKAAELLTQEPEPTQPHKQPELDPVTLSKINAWESETDETGNLLRPWLLDGHPMKDFAFQQATALMNHPQLQNRPTEDILATLDAIMSPAQQQQQPAEAVRRPAPPQVLSSNENLRTRKEGNKITVNSLSPEQKRVASRLWPNLSSDDAAKKYLAGFRKVSG